MTRWAQAQGKTVPGNKSFVRNILPISSLKPKILQDFRRNLLIPQDQGGGGYLTIDRRRARTTLTPGGPRKLAANVSVTRAPLAGADGAVEVASC